MTGVVGTKVLATDFNSIQSTIASVMGSASVGSTYGYGQNVASTSVATTSKITAVNWQHLFSDISNAYAHQTGTAPSASVLPPVSVGSKITAANLNAFASVAATCSTNRLTVALSNLTITAPTSATTLTCTSAWGGGQTGITGVASFTWASEAQAAAFFNTGGYITMKLAQPTVATQQDTAWNSFLASFGTFIFSGSGSSKAGGNGAMTSIPYSGYTTAGSVVLNQVSMTNSSYSSYANADYVTVSVQKITNGLQISVLLEDNFTSQYADSVSSGTNFAFGWAKSIDTNNLSVATVAPTFGVVTVPTSANSG
jgi:hypothetical protein